MHQTAKAFTISGFEQCLIDAEGSCVATADEIEENLLAKILNKKSMSAETAMKTFLMELSGQEIDSAPFALLKRSRQGTKDAPVVVEIPGASFTLIGASTPAKFYEALTGGAVSDGFLNRFLIINGDPQPERENWLRKPSPCRFQSSRGCRLWRPRDASQATTCLGLAYGRNMSVGGRGGRHTPRSGPTSLASRCEAYRGPSRLLSAFTRESSRTSLSWRLCSPLHGTRPSRLSIGQTSTTSRRWFSKVSVRQSKASRRTSPTLTIMRV